MALSIDQDLNSEEAYPWILTSYSRNQKPNKLIVYAKYGYFHWVNLVLISGYSDSDRLDGALWTAFQNGHIKVAELLLNFGVSPRLTSESPIFSAIKNNQIEILQLLIFRRFRFDSSEVEQAARVGSVPTFKLIMENSLCSNQSLPEFLRTAIHWDNQELIKYLHSRGVKIKSFYIDFVTRLDIKTVELLIELGYDPKIFNYRETL